MENNEASQVRMGGKVEKNGIFNCETFCIQLQQLELLDPAPGLKVPHNRNRRKCLDILLSYYKLWVAVLAWDKMFGSINLYARWSDFSCSHSKLPKVEQEAESSI